MSSISFRMSGSGSWLNLLPDEDSRRLYADIYPLGAPLPTRPGHLRKLLPVWQQAGIVRLENQKIIPFGPVLTDEDLSILNPWFKDISNFMSLAVIERLDDYRMLALNLTKGHSARKEDLDNLLTILICALTLDSGVFSMLRREVLGTYPPRGPAGNFFFWGYAFGDGPQRIFGFTTYNGLDGKQLHLIRSHELDRRSLKAVLNRGDTWNYLNRFLAGLDKGSGAILSDWQQSSPRETVEDLLQKAGLLTLDKTPQLAVPIFDDSDREAVSDLCREPAQKILDHFLLEMEGLHYLAGQCSFVLCSWPDVLCMLFHLVYSYAADRLVEKGVISDFPQEAGGQWGVWIS